MMLIYIRLDAGIPVIISGDAGINLKFYSFSNYFSGVGKTRLVKYLIEEVLKWKLY